MKPTYTLALTAALFVAGLGLGEARPLKLHAIFTDHMVLQRDKPITIWGWADDGDRVSVALGAEKAEAKATGADGRWEVTLPARAANSEAVELTASSGDETVHFSDVLIGDVWVMYGQSNMALGLDKILGSDIARLESNLPQLRHFRIQTNEQQTLQSDIRPEAIENGGWEISGPETSGGFSAIGYHFGATLQRTLGIPIGVITAARGGASIESLVPARKFDEDPLAKRYAESVEKRIKEFNPETTSLEIWQRQLDRAKSKKLPEDQWPKKPVNGDNLRSWNIPGMSPSDRAGVYNGMFGVFKGFGIKGVLFHQGYNNAISSNCRPKRYRVLTKLMIEGIREDFNDPDLPFAIIGLCAGGNAQNQDNFEFESFDGGPYIRESQRLGLADVANQQNLAFLPAYDVRIPGLHPPKKAEHGLRAARWALARIYQPSIKADWREVKLLSAEPQGEEFILTFDASVMDDNQSSIPEGFSIAGEDGKFYMAHARYQEKEGHPNKRYDVIRVWSPLVKKPVAIRYAWSRAPMGNLKHQGNPDRPFPSFRTDSWDYPESEDPEISAVGRPEHNAMKADAQARLELRRSEEAKRGVELMEGIEKLKRP